MQTSAVLGGSNDRSNSGQHQEVIEVQILPQVIFPPPLFCFLFKFIQMNVDDIHKNKKNRFFFSFVCKRRHLMDPLTWVARRRRLV